MINGSIFSTKTFLILSALFISAFILMPLLGCGLIGDDSINSLTRGALLLEHENLWRHSYHIFMQWVTGPGRFFPVAFYGYSLHYLLPNLLSNKLSVLLFVLINLGMFGYLVKLMTKSFLSGIMSIIIVAVFFQFRIYHDPILSFTTLLQVVTMFSFASFISLIFYLQKGGWYYLVISLVLYLAAMWTYEITYLFFILHFLIILFYSKNRDISYICKIELLFFILFFVCILIPVCIRLHFGIPIAAKGSTDVYVSNLNFTKFILTFAKQAVSTLPLSYYFVGPEVKFILTSFLIATGYFLFFLLISTKSFVSSARKKVDNLKLLLFFGMGLWLLPGILPSFSPKIQDQLSWGLGYLSVYVSYFGFAMVTVSVMHSIYAHYLNSKMVVKVLIVVFATVFSLICFFTYNLNDAVVKSFNLYWLYPRADIEKAMHNGLLNYLKLEPDSILLIDGIHPWDRREFYFMEAGVRFGYVGDYCDFRTHHELNKKFIVTGKNKRRYDFSSGVPVYYLRYNSIPNSGGYIILSHIKSLLGTDVMSSVGSKDIYIYIISPLFVERQVHVMVSGSYFYTAKVATGLFLRYEEKDMNLVAKGGGWKMFSVKLPKNLADPMSLRVSIVHDIN